MNGGEAATDKRDAKLNRLAEQLEEETARIHDEVELLRAKTRMLRAQTRLLRAQHPAELDDPDREAWRG